MVLNKHYNLLHNSKDFYCSSDHMFSNSETGIGGKELPNFMELAIFFMLQLINLIRNRGFTLIKVFNLFIHFTINAKIMRIMVTLL